MKGKTGKSPIESGTTEAEGVSKNRSTACDVSPPHEIVGSMRKRPRWTIAFLRALERTGEVQFAAEDAGVDKSTAYARRRAHPDFAEAWAAALRRFKEAKNRAAVEEVARLREGPSTTFGGPPPQDKLGEELIASNGQVKRVSAERWSKRKERIFFDELAASNNISRAARAAGVSYNAVHARRLRDPLFAAKWDAVGRTSRAVIDMHLLAETRKTFDPAALNLPEGAPRVTIDQAIKISQIGAAKDKGARAPFGDQTANMGEEESEELREQLVQRLLALRRRERSRLLAEGWTYDEAHDRDIPPGWGKLTD